MIRRSDKYTTLARRTIQHWFKENTIYKPNLDELPAELTKRKAGVFVSLHKNDGLRGCIGTFEPTKENIAQEIISSAISAAFCDTRFAPLDKKELDDISIEVSILHPREKISSPKELDPKKYGVIIETPEKQCGLLLPDIEGVDTVEDQVAIASRKCGTKYSPETHTLYRFTVEKHVE